MAKVCPFVVVFVGRTFVFVFHSNRCVGILVNFCCYPRLCVRVRRKFIFALYSNRCVGIFAFVCCDEFFLLFQEFFIEDLLLYI